MNNLLSLLPEGGWPRLVCDALWQSTLIATCGLLAARFLVRESTARAWLLLLTISGCVIAPFATFVVRQEGIGLYGSRVANVAVYASSAKPRVEQKAIGPATELTLKSESVSKVFAESVHLNVQPPAGSMLPVELATRPPIRPKVFAPSTSTAEPPADGASTAIQMNWFAALAIVWVALSVSLFLRLCHSWVVIRRLLRAAVSCEDEILLAAMRQAAQRVGFAKAPLLLTSSRIATPMVLAFGRTRLLVPHVATSLRDAREVDLPTAAKFAGSSKRDMSSHLGETWLHDERPSINWVAAFTHELAHVARHDGWSRLAVEVILIVLPCQPLVWLARHSFRTACEEACDDWAVATGTDPVDLAEMLTAWINVRGNQAMPLAAGMSSTKARTLRLLALRDKPIARLSSAWRWFAIPIAVLLTTGLALAQHKGGDQNKSTSPSPQQSAANESSKKAAQASDADLDQKRVLQDILIVLYGQRMAEYKSVLAEKQSQLEAIKAGKRQATQRDQDDLHNDIQSSTDRIKEYQEKIDKRTAELRARFARESHDLTSPAESAGGRRSPAAYIIEPPDILDLTPVRLVSLDPIKIQPGDKLQIDVEGTKYDEPIHGIFKIDSSGEVVLGPSYGSVKVSGLTRSEAQEAVKTQLEAALMQPQVALTIDESRIETGITGKHAVAPDGTINLGVYGEVKVAGETIEQARAAIQDTLAGAFHNPLVAVDVFAYNSKVFYVVLRQQGVAGDEIQRVPLDGNETLLDAIAQTKLPAGTAIENISIARPAAKGQKEQTIAIDWNAALKGSNSDANPLIQHGDRIFVSLKWAAVPTPTQTAPSYNSPYSTPMPAVPIPAPNEKSDGNYKIMPIPPARSPGNSDQGAANPDQLPRYAPRANE